MAQLINITSEALQATIRRLLPSQAGFSEDLQATNLIQPVIDITQTAEGSQLPLYLQRAFDFSSTAFFVSNTVSTVANTPGFFQVTGTITCQHTTGVEFGALQLYDGSTRIRIYQSAHSASGLITNIGINEICFLRPGDTLELEATAGVNVAGSLRQVADQYGNLQQPLGFAFE